MSAPLVWIILPGVAAGGLYLLRRWPRLTALLGGSLAIGLALFAWRFPIGAAASLGPWDFKLEGALMLLGRRLELFDADRPLLTLVYLSAAFWFGGALAVRPGRLAAPLGLAALSLLMAALAVEPFLYAALLIELAVLVIIPMLAPPGHAVGRGVVRFLTFQTLGIPFVLFTGWLLSGVETNPGDQSLALRAGILLGVGFSFLLAVFPFHTWVPMLGEETHPYAALWVFVIIPEMVMLFGLSFLDRYAWLRDMPATYTALRLAGVLMLATSGLWMAFQRHLGRMLAFAALFEIGLALLALSLPQGVSLHFALLPARILALGVWALALAALRRVTPDLNFRSVEGAARRLPVVTAALFTAQLSVAGLPLLAGFPVRLALLEALSVSMPWAALCLLASSLGLLLGALRVLAALLRASEGERWQMSERGLLLVFLIAGMAALLFLGLFPYLVLPLLRGLEGVFPQLTL